MNPSEILKQYDWEKGPEAIAAMQEYAGKFAEWADMQGWCYNYVNQRWAFNGRITLETGYKTTDELLKLFENA